jgi:hypothetical protein
VKQKSKERNANKGQRGRDVLGRKKRKSFASKKKNFSRPATETSQIKGTGKGKGKRAVSFASKMDKYLRAVSQTKRLRRFGLKGYSGQNRTDQIRNTARNVRADLLSAYEFIEYSIL